MKTSSPNASSVYVVWPPVWNASDPHVAAPALCSYLTAQGIPVRQWDLNIDFFRHVVAEDVIEEQARRSRVPPPPGIQRAIDFARTYYNVTRMSLDSGIQQRFSNDAEQQLLIHALAIFNHFHSETTFSTLGVYHSGDAEDSDYLRQFAELDAANPFTAFYQKTILPDLARELPRIVGISVCGAFQLGAALTLARMVKQIAPHTCTVIGGAFFSTLPQTLLRRKTAGNFFQYVDAFIFNEGEIPFLRLIQQVLGGSVPQPAANVFLHGQHELNYEPLQCLAAEQIATPQFAPGAVERYFRRAPRIPVEVSRGCYWGRCTFCNLASGANKRYRAIPTDHIIQAVRTLSARHRSTHILFSTLAMAPRVLRQVAARLVEEGIAVSWSAWIRPEKSLTRRDLELIKESGCSSLAVTPESFNNNTLSRMDKGIERQHLMRLMRELSELGLCGSINLIPGFPGETVDDFMSTVEDCAALGLRGEFFPFCLLKNSPVYQDPKRFGVLVREQPAKDLAFAVSFSYESETVAACGAELIRLAAARYPGRVFADDPFAGYTFDFSPQRMAHAEPMTA
jgi:radical SAM superfamily enzyme YgiQ (UPF0313 family)